jgi:hypothetical protein
MNLYGREYNKYKRSITQLQSITVFQLTDEVSLGRDCSQSYAILREQPFYF